MPFYYTFLRHVAGCCYTDQSSKGNFHQAPARHYCFPVKYSAGMGGRFRLPVDVVIAILKYIARAIWIRGG